MNGIRHVVREIVFVVALALVVFSPGALVLVAQGGPPAGLPDLVGMLKATPGCLGVDAARTMSGKQVIFAWFENKKALLNWYYSAGHQQLITSLTLSDKPQVANVELPVSQIAIELYAPLPGGLSAGGRFAPSTVTVKGL